jgi:cell wall-associated NlpC family hydrolase
VLKRILAFTSSMLVTAGMTPWPLESSFVSKEHGAVDHTVDHGVNVALSSRAARRATGIPVSLRYFQYKRRLQEIHYAVSQQWVVPLWQDPRNRNGLGAKQLKGRASQVDDKSRLKKAKRRAQSVSQDVGTAVHSVELSSRGGVVSGRDYLSKLGGKISSLALSLTGTPYRWGGAATTGFDCSGFTQYVYKKVGIVIPRTSYEQFRVGKVVGWSQLQPGDLVFFSTDGPGPSHVAIYIGNGLIVQALNASTGVIISHISNGYYANRFLGGRRL